MRTAALARLSLTSLAAAGCAVLGFELAQVAVTFPVHQLRIAWTVTRFLVEL